MTTGIANELEEPTMRPLMIAFFSLLLTVQLSGCAPEVGSERWCNNMKEKPKGDWSANEAADFARHCLL